MEKQSYLPSIKAVHLASGIRLGLFHYSQGRLDDAKAIFRGLAFLDPRNPYLHALLGSVLQKQGKDGKPSPNTQEPSNIFLKTSVLWPIEVNFT
jgi:hypothetical protein